MKRLATFLIFLSFALSRTAFADCHQMSAAEMDHSLQQNPDIPVTQLLALNVVFPASTSLDPDLAVGSTIVTGKSSSLANPHRVAVCTETGGFVDYHYLNPTASGLTNDYGTIYNTNVTGVGFQLFTIVGGTPVAWPRHSDVVPGVDHLTYIRLPTGSQMSIVLYKTGDIASNVVVAFGTVGQLITQVGQTVMTVSANNTNIKVLPSCQVDSSALNIDFGQFGPHSVSTTDGPTQPVNFNVRCSGPTPPVTVTATLSGTPDTNNPSLLKNTGANNLAIRLQETSTGTVLKPNDATSSLVHTPGGEMQSAFRMNATVLRVGSTAPTAGKIEATATVTLTIL